MDLQFAGGEHAFLIDHKIDGRTLMPVSPASAANLHVECALKGPMKGK